MGKKYAKCGTKGLSFKIVEHKSFMKISTMP